MPTPEQYTIFAQAIIACGSVEKASERISIGRSTGYVWFNTEEVQSELSNFRSEMRQAAISKASEKAAAMFAVIANVAEDENIAPEHRVRAAVAYLEQLNKHCHQADLESEVKQLRAIITPKAGKTSGLAEELAREKAERIDRVN